ncbi:NADPH:quinone oxidoreductase family protein [Sinorhizobium sp. BJ1]|uniref:NADPH:quinone oxidoreductase family protein n=1 Tax=Sinorhizobium sp. BJ1 TaxID=2035455 RepID=UPI000BEA28DF|nr:NADPH:quinone oxidoreductase family protein [Sinorhizobium sp. BJ1]PDT76968.1 NADPH:quinone oxidoreductase [Sinorhizobium sp. BJ1]
MKALLSKGIGGPKTLVLEDVPNPKAAPGSAVVEVKAVGVNYLDVLVIEDKYQFKPPRPFSPGGEISGVVKEVGDGVVNVKPGDRVLGTPNFGGMAEEIVIEAANLVRIPVTMPFDEAAAFMYTYGVSHYALKHRGRLRSGESLLVLGAAGGVGLAAVELGRSMGARVIAAASSQEKVDLALARGAESGVVYPHGSIDRDGQKELAARFKQAAAPGGVNLVCDPVGGDYAEAAVRSMARAGRYLVVGFAAGIPRIPLNLPLLKGCDILGVIDDDRDPAEHQQDVKELLKLYAAGKIKPHISERFSLAHGADAIGHLAARRALGRVVVLI